MNEYSHQKITELVLKNSFSDRFSNEEIKEILKGVILPDKDENQNGYTYHFYNPVTNANYLGNELHAKAKCVYHFGEYYKTKDLVELGRAIHFLEDICTPVHTQYEDTSDSILKLKLHLDFEKDLDLYLKNFITGNIKSLKNDKGSLSEFINNIALNSARNYYIYKKYGKESDALIETINLSYDSIFCFINKYVDENQIEEVKKIESKGNVVGIAIKEKNNSLNVETINPNYKLRLNNKELLIFKKGGTLKNYELEEIIQIE